MKKEEGNMAKRAGSKSGKKASKGKATSAIVKGKKVLCFGETNDITQEVIEALVEAAGGEVVHAITECFS